MKKNLLKVLIISFVTLFYGEANAQINLADSVSNLRTCLDSQRMKFNFSGTTGPSAATRTVDVLLPSGHVMGGLVSSSVTGGGLVTLLAGTQPNGAYRFEVTGGGSNANIEIVFLQAASCAAGTGTYTARDSVIYNDGTANTSFPGTLFNGVSPDLSITSITNTPTSATVGTVVTRKYTVTNGGFGPTRNFIIVDRATDITHYTIDQTTVVIDPSGANYSLPIANISLNGDSLIFNFDEAIIQQIANTGTNADWFENGESFEIEYDLTINTCQPPSITSELLTSWRCSDLSRCNYASINTGVSTFGPALPNIVVAQRLRRQGDCFDNTTVHRDTLVLRNAGGPAANISMDAGGTRGAVFGNYAGAYFDTAEFFIQIGINGVKFKPTYTIESSLTSTYSGCNFTGKPNQIRFTIPFLDAGDSLYIYMGQVQCQYTKSCEVNQSFSSPRYINGTGVNFTYQNSCQNATFNGGWRDAMPYRSHYAEGSNSGPSQVGDGQSADLSLDISNFSNNYLYEFHRSGNGYREVSIVKPNVLIYDPAYPNPVYFQNGSNFLYPYKRSGDTFTFRVHNGFTGIGSVFHAKVKGQCDGVTCSGILEYELQFRSNPDTTSCTRENPEICLKYPFAWTSSCKVCCPKGMVNLRYDVNRLTYGRADDNNDGLESGVLDVSQINTKRSIPGDTIEFVHKFYLKTDAIDTQWDYLRSIMEVASTTHYSIVSDSVFVDRLTGPDSIFEMTPTLNGTTGFITDLSAMPAFQQGDTVTVRLKLRTIRNPPGQAVVSYNSSVGGGASNDNFVTSYSCGAFIDKMEIFSVYGFGYHSFNTSINGCQQYRIPHYFYTSIGPGSPTYNNTRFPYEYRPLMTPLKLKVAIPKGFSVDSVEMRTMTGGYGSLSSYYPPDTNIAYTFVNDTLRIDIRWAMQPFGGKIPVADEGGIFYLNTWVTPSCKTVSGVQNVFRVWDSFEYTTPLSYSEYNEATSGPRNAYLRNFHPNLIWSSSTPISAGYSKNITWPVSVRNLTAFSATRNWMYVTNQSGDVTVDSIQEAGVTIPKDANGFYRIGSVASNATRNFTVFGTSGACEFDSIAINTGWACGEYPTMFTDSTCGATPLPIYVQPQPASIQTQITALSATPSNPFDGSSATHGSSEITMCESFPFEMEIQSTQPGNIYDVIEEILLPFNGGMSGLDLVFDSVTVEYPQGTAPRLAAHQGRSLMSSSVPTGAMTIDIQKLDTVNFGDNPGLKGTGLAGSNAERIFTIRWKMITNCNIKSGDQWNTRQKANQACGTVATGDEQITSGFAIDIAGTPKPYSVTTNIDPNVGGCSAGNCDTTTIDVLKVGSGIAALADSFFIEMPVSISIGTVTCEGGNCPGGVTGVIPASTISEVIVDGKRVITFPVPTEFDNNADLASIKIQTFSTYKGSCETSLLMNAGVRIPATLVCKGVPCPASDASLGSKSGSFDIEMPILNFTDYNAVYGYPIVSPYEYYYWASLKNTGKQATESSLIIQTYFDKNNNGMYDADPIDSLAYSQTITTQIMPDSTLVIADSFFTPLTPPSPNMPMYSVIDTSAGAGNCLCNGIAPSNFINSLPVEYLYFEGRLQNNANTELKWATANEYNSLRFDVYRSVGTALRFEKLGHLPAAGNSSSVLNYEFNDDVRTLPAGPIFYRLVQVDANGDASPSNIISVVKLPVIDVEQVTISPNPAKDNVTVSINNLSDGEYPVQLIDATGKVALSASIKVVNGTASYQLDLTRLPSGIYSFAGFDKVLKLSVVKK